MMRLLTTLTAVSIAMLSLGCVRTSHKLSEVGETVTDDEIVGVWEEQDPIFGARESDRICIEACNDGRYQIRSLDSDDEAVNPFRLVRAADATFIEIDFNELLEAEADGDLNQDSVEECRQSAPFLFPIRWERRGEWMARWDADGSVLEQLINEGKLKGHSNGHWPLQIVVTSTAAELETCLRHHGDEIYAAAMNDSRGVFRRVYRRVSAQVPAEASEPTSTP